MKHILPFMAFAILMLAAPIAHAASLDSVQVEKFIASMKDVHVMADEMEAEGKNEIMSARVKPEAGEKFAVYTKAVSTLKSEFPSDYKKLGKITKTHGFSSQENWGSTGDMVMQAYMATQMGDAPAQMKQMQENMPPEVLAQMPPEAKAQMENSLKMLKAIKDVPPAHVETVKPYIPQLQAAMDDE